MLEEVVGPELNWYVVFGMPFRTIAIFPVKVSLAVNVPVVGVARVSVERVLLELVIKLVLLLAPPVRVAKLGLKPFKSRVPRVTVSVLAPDPSELAAPGLRMPVALFTVTVPV